MRLINAEPLEELLRSRCEQLSNVCGNLAGAVSGCLRLVQSCPTISALPNEPLTLDELREMDMELVWVDFPKCPEASRWMLISTGRHCVYDGLLGYCDFDNYGKTWLAYRRRPDREAVEA